MLGFRGPVVCAGDPSVRDGTGKGICRPRDGRYTASSVAAPVRGGGRRRRERRVVVSMMLPVDASSSASREGETPSPFKLVRGIVQERVPLVDVVGGKVELRQVGSRHVGLCPFHNEKTPSFTVFEEENTFFCFGCRKRGDAISFVMETEELTFTEAVRVLAENYGFKRELDILWKPTHRSEEAIAAEAHQQQRNEALLKVLRAVAEFYHEELWNGSADSLAALEYMRRRGFTDETLRCFLVGFAPRNGSRLATHLLTTQGFPESDAVESGVLFPSKDQRGYFDALQGRVAIPITDGEGKVIGFGGRKIVEEDWGPKYLNTRETGVFRKGLTLFADPLVPSPRRPATAVIVEGYFDAMKMQQEGMCWAVASLGTGLTLDQLRLAAKHSTERAVTVNMDGDDAGNAMVRKACEALFPRAMKEGIDVRVAFLPEGIKDPDSFLESSSVSEYVDSVLSGAESWFLWYAKQLAKNVWNIESMGALLKQLGGILAESIPPRKEGTGFVVREYAKTIAKTLAVCFDRPEFETETVEEIVTGFWNRRTGGRFIPEKQTHVVSTGGAPGVLEDDRVAPNFQSRVQKDLIFRSEKNFLRALIQSKNLRQLCMSTVEERGIKFVHDPHMRVFQWLSAHAEDADVEELHEELKWDRPVQDIDSFLQPLDEATDLATEVEKCLAVMEIRRCVAVVKALDILVEEALQKLVQEESNNLLASLHARRSAVQERVTQLLDEYPEDFADI